MTEDDDARTTREQASESSYSHATALARWLMVEVAGEEMYPAHRLKPAGALSSRQ